MSASGKTASGDDVIDDDDDLRLSNCASVPFERSSMYQKLNAPPAVPMMNLKTELAWPTSSGVRE